jgi:hypothetical protein
LAGDTFIDDDGDYLNYTALLNNKERKKDLKWLKFDPETRTFKGTPRKLESINIIVIAED